MKNTIEQYVTVVDGKKTIHPRHLRVNPLNKSIYSNGVEEQATRADIAASMIHRVEQQGLVGNKQPIKIWLDGLVEAGNTRAAAALQADLPLWFEYSDEPYPDDTTPYTNLEVIKSSNIYRTYVPSVKLKEYMAMERAYVMQFGDTRPAKEREDHLRTLRIGKGSIDKLKVIAEYDEKEGTNYMKRVDATDLAIGAAFDIVKGQGGALKHITVSNNPNRDWSAIYDDNVFRTALHRLNNIISGTRAQHVMINEEEFTPFMEFDRASTSAMISHLAEHIFTAVLKGEGHNVQAASGHPTDPDIYHIDLDDKVEIKVTEINGGSTTWKGGRGCREGAYILIAYDASIQRWLVIFTKLDRNDWSGIGSMGGTKLSVKKVLENHEDDMVLVNGTLAWNGDKINVAATNLDALHWFK